MDSSLWVSLLCPLVVYVWLKHRDPLNVIPTVGGPSVPLLSYIGAFKFLVRAQELIQAGYDKHRGSPFKIAMFEQWLIVLSGSDIVEEVRKLPGDAASPGRGILFLTQLAKYVHPDVFVDHYHVDIIRNTLTRQLGALMPAMVDELEVVCGELLPAKEGDTVSLPGSKTMLDVVARVISRAFVGLPLCTDAQYLDAAVFFTNDLVKARMIINLSPESMKWFVSRLITGPSKNLQWVMGLLMPAVHERIAQFKQREKDSTDAPNDMLQLILDEARERKEFRLCHYAFASSKLLCDPHLVKCKYIDFSFMIYIYVGLTLEQSLTHALFHLLANPSIIPSLREDIEEIVSREGWTKTALDKTWKLDSLLRESQRFTGITVLGMLRRAMKDITLADGTYLPEGCLFAFAGQATHSDNRNYDRSEQFEPFRFSDLREAGESHQFVNTSSEYMPFGRGKHACPGRFFASMELKAVLAYLILHYDMKFEGETAGRPANFTLSFSVIPSQDAVIRFKRRCRS